MHPGLLPKLFGYGTGAYISIPNYGLIDEETIPESEMLRHVLIKNVPFIIYIVAEVAFTFSVLNIVPLEGLFPALLPMLIIYPSAAVLNALINWLALSRKYKRIFIGATFVVVGVGAYATSFVVDMVVGVFAGLATTTGVIWPCLTWSQIALISLAICVGRPVPFLIRAAPYWLFGVMALIASLASGWNLITATLLILGGFTYGIFGGQSSIARKSRSSNAAAVSDPISGGNT